MLLVTVVLNLEHRKITVEWSETFKVCTRTWEPAFLTRILSDYDTDELQTTLRETVLGVPGQRSLQCEMPYNHEN